MPVVGEGEVPIPAGVAQIAGDAFRFGFFRDLGCDDFEQMPAELGEVLAVEACTEPDHGRLRLRLDPSSEVGGESAAPS